MRTTTLILALTILGLSSACDRVQRKGKALAHETKAKVKNKTADWVDQAMPRFDAYTPDTKYNKLRFADFLQVPLTPDIKNIYCHADAMGIDADYQIAFQCNAATAKQIIAQHDLKIPTDDDINGLGLTDSFPWWDTAKINNLQCYTKGYNHDYYQCFWYNEATKQAYYLDFDM